MQVLFGAFASVKGACIHPDASTFCYSASNGGSAKYVPRVMPDTTPFVTVILSVVCPYRKDGSQMSAIIEIACGA